ncbi:branched-chain-amino-acid aminotransferase, cytosolic-like isoform X2 [Tubulanus polymorphus]
MLSIHWKDTVGWASPRIHPVKPLQLHPGAKVLHYANELFEGMKAYRGVDNKIRMFRPRENMIRMNSSAVRATLPTFDGDVLVKLMKKLIHIDQEWVPYSTTSTLYLRPTMIAVDPSLGVRPPQEALLFVLLSPVGPYFPTGLKPVSLLADPAFVRAWPGGSGNTKMGSNYAPTTYIQQIAEERGCQQVLWLYGQDEQVTEVGTMNLFMYWVNENGENELITPPLSTGVILPGVTRKSLIELAQNWGEFKVSERSFNMGDVVKALKEGRVKEIFGAGTACLVCPVESILYKNEKLHIPTMDQGAKLTNRFLDEITAIQFGRVTPHEWVQYVEDQTA